MFVPAFLASMIGTPSPRSCCAPEDKRTIAIGSRLFLFNQRYLWGDFAATAILAGFR